MSLYQISNKEKLESVLLFKFKNIDLHSDLIYFFPSESEFFVVYEAQGIIRKIKVNKFGSSNPVNMMTEQSTFAKWENRTSCHLLVSEGFICIGTLIGEIKILNAKSMKFLNKVSCEFSKEVLSKDSICSLHFLEHSALLVIGNIKGKVFTSKILFEESVFSTRDEFNFQVPKNAKICFKGFIGHGSLIVLHQGGMQTMIRLNDKGFIQNINPKWLVVPHYEMSKMDLSMQSLSSIQPVICVDPNLQYNILIYK